MTQHWLKYWRSEQIQSGLQERELDHVASSQLNIVQNQPGAHTLWIVNSSGGRLRTIGFLRVGRILSRRDAERELGYEVYPAKWHALAKPGTAVIAREIDIQRLATRLSFEGRTERLKLIKGGTNGQQLQRLRRLTPGSARMMEDAWANGVKALDAEYLKLEAGLDEADSFDTERIQKARKEQGWLRDRLFAGSEIGICAICHLELPRSLLVAAHIRKRAMCTQHQKADWKNNIMPLCRLGCDDLFERGYLIVQNKTVRRGRRGPITEALEEYIGEVVGEHCTYFHSGSSQYFDWHAVNALAES